MCLPGVEIVPTPCGNILHASRASQFICFSLVVCMCFCYGVFLLLMMCCPLRNLKFGVSPRFPLCILYIAPPNLELLSQLEWFAPLWGDRLKIEAK